MAPEGRIAVEVVFALPDRQELLRVALPSGSTVAEGIDASAIASRFPHQDLKSCAVGIWGRLVDRDHVLEDGDRIEIYRPLEIDPRDARRKLAAEGKSMGRQQQEIKRD